MDKEYILYSRKHILLKCNKHLIAMHSFRIFNTDKS